MVLGALGAEALLVSDERVRHGGLLRHLPRRSWGQRLCPPPHSGSHVRHFGFCHIDHGCPRLKIQPFLHLALSEVTSDPAFCSCHRCGQPTPRARQQCPALSAVFQTVVKGQKRRGGHKRPRPCLASRTAALWRHPVFKRNVHALLRSAGERKKNTEKERKRKNR